jgi:hypothetical protein
MTGFAGKIGIIAAAIMFAAPNARAAYEIYSPDMQSAYDTAENANAPCSNGGYFGKYPVYDMGSCQSCQASIKKAKGYLDDYQNLCTHTQNVEADATGNAYLIANMTPSTQGSSERGSGNVQNDGNVGETQKRADANTLLNDAKSCEAAVKCVGNIAPEDLAAGKAEKKACSDIENGSNFVMNEKTADSTQMSQLSGHDMSNAANLDQLGAGPGSAAAGATISAAAGALSAAAAGAALANAAAGAGLNSVPNAPASAALPGTRSSTVAANQVPGAQNLSWSDYQRLAAGGANYDAATNSGTTGNTLGDASPNATGTNSTSNTTSASGRKAYNGSNDPDSNVAVTQKGHGYTDPWLEFMSGDARRSLVEKLAESPGLRKKIKGKIQELEEEEAAEPGRAAQLRERVEFYRTALAEAEKLLRQGNLQALAPMDPREAFAMDEKGTRNEIERMLASLEADDVGDTVTPLFTRVHRAISRQLNSGHLRVKILKVTRNGEK